MSRRSPTLTARSLNYHRSSWLSCRYTTDYEADSKCGERQYLPGKRSEVQVSSSGAARRSVSAGLQLSNMCDCSAIEPPKLKGDTALLSKFSHNPRPRQGLWPVGRDALSPAACFDPSSTAAIGEAVTRTRSLRELLRFPARLSRRGQTRFEAGGSPQLLGF